MPAAIPVIVGFAGAVAGAGAIAAGATGLAAVAAYASVAGGVLTGIGAVTGSKDLKKVGAILSIGGGLGQLASGLAGGAAAATGASEAAGAGAATELATAAAPAAEAGIGAATTASEAAQAAAPEIASTLQSATPTAGAVADASQAAPLSLAQPATQNVGMLGTTSAPLEVPGGTVAPTVSVDSPTVASDLANGGGTSVATSPGANNRTLLNGVERAADPAAYTSSSPLQQWLDKLMGGAKAVGSFVKDNKELVALGGQALGSMYGPQAERLDLEKSIYDRQRQNLNSPVRLYYKKGG